MSVKKLHNSTLANIDVQPTTITACDALHFSNVVAKVCEYVPLSKDAYLHIFFETGCQFIEKQNLPKKVTDMILQDRSFGFWEWFLIEYIHRDEALQNSNVPYRDYEKYKRMWIHTFNINSSFQNFLKFKHLYETKANA